MPHGFPTILSELDTYYANDQIRGMTQGDDMSTMTLDPAMRQQGIEHGDGRVEGLRYAGPGDVPAGST